MICITNSARDVSLAGLRFRPDLDAICRVLRPDGGAVAAGPDARTATGTAALRRAGLIPAGAWSWVDDEAIAAAVTRAYREARGESASEVAARQWNDAHASGRPQDGDGTEPYVTVFPLTEEPIELHAIEEGEESSGDESSDGAEGGTARTSRHAMRWIEDPNRRTPMGFVVVGAQHATPAPGVLDGLRATDVVLVPPMSPVLDMAGFLAVDGVRDALRGTTARVVVLSPVELDGDNDGEVVTADDVTRASWPLTGGEIASTTLATLYADFADVLVIDDAEPPARYPASLTVMRAPLRAALAGDAAAARALREIVFG